MRVCYKYTVLHRRRRQRQQQHPADGSDQVPSPISEPFYCPYLVPVHLTRAYHAFIPFHGNHRRQAGAAVGEGEEKVDDEEAVVARLMRMPVTDGKVRPSPLFSRPPPRLSSKRSHPPRSLPVAQVREVLGVVLASQTWKMRPPAALPDAGTAARAAADSSVGLPPRPLHGTAAAAAAANAEPPPPAAAAAAATDKPRSKTDVAGGDSGSDSDAALPPLRLDLTSLTAGLGQPVGKSKHACVQFLLAAARLSSPHPPADAAAVAAAETGAGAGAGAGAGGADTDTEAAMMLRRARGETLRRLNDRSGVAAVRNPYPIFSPAPLRPLYTLPPPSPTARSPTAWPCS